MHICKSINKKIYIYITHCLSLATQILCFFVFLIMEEKINKCNELSQIKSLLNYILILHLTLEIKFNNHNIASQEILVKRKEK